MRRIGLVAPAVGAFFFLAAPAAHAQSTDLIVNGSFEEPALGGNTWNTYSSIPGWTAINSCRLEIQSHGNAGSPDTGDQLTELDSNCSSGIYQDVPTTPGFAYTLSYAFSARPYTGSDDNHVIVKWGGAQVDEHTTDGLYLLDTLWNYFSPVVTATAATARLEFDDAGISNSLGTYIDSVSLVLNPQATVDNYCPCASAWANHGDYVTCVVGVTNQLKSVNVITGAESGAIRSAAAQSACGK